MSDDLTRRDFAKLGAKLGLVGGVSVATSAGLSREAHAAPHVARALANPADLPKAKGPRIVVIGGGWSGLTLAKYVKKAHPAADVVLIEKRSTFVSHPIANLLLAEMINLDRITYSFIDAARNNDYIYLQAAAVDVDRSARRVFTDRGWVDYDFLAIAPGIDYDYAAFGIKDAETRSALATHYPAGFVHGSEHITLRNKVRAFKGGVFLLNPPPGIFRCSATPYERACVIAAHIQKNKIAGKVVLIDPRPQPEVKGEGFLAAFEELYPDTIEYITSTNISGIEVKDAGGVLFTDFDDIPFADAAIYPRVRAARLIEDLGLVDPASTRHEANIDPITYQVVGDDRAFVTGDARNHPFSKSANAAYVEARYVAKVIVARLTGGASVPWESPRTICYSMVDPLKGEAIAIDTTYKRDKKTKEWGYQAVVQRNTRSKKIGDEGYAWADERLKDMFF